jgi:hypothetical protein
MHNDDYLGAVNYPLQVLYSNGNGLGISDHHIFNTEGVSIGTLNFGTKYEASKFSSNVT